MSSTGNTGQKSSFYAPISNWRPPSYGSVNANQSSWNIPQQVGQTPTSNYQPQTGQSPFPKTIALPAFPQQTVTPEQQYQNGGLTIALPAFNNTQSQPTEFGGGNPAFPKPKEQPGLTFAQPLRREPQVSQEPPIPQTIAPPAFDKTQPNNFGFPNNYRHRGGK